MIIAMRFAKDKRDFDILDPFMCFCTYIGAKTTLAKFYNVVKKNWNSFTMNAEIEKRIGQNIRMLRERAGMTQELLSIKLQLGGCDLTRSAVAKIEVGQRHLYPDEIVLLKSILNASYDEIFNVD